MIRCSTRVLSSVGKAGDGCELGLQHFQFDDHVPEQLATRGVRERTVVSQLVDLADVVQESAGQQQVAIDLRIVPADQIAGAAQRDHVVEQASDVGVVQSLGSGRSAVGLRNLRVGHESFDQGLEVGVLKGGDKSRQGLPELVDIFGGLGKVVGEIDFRFLPGGAACGW